MENTNNILTGLSVTSQVPLNKKEYIINENALKDLGTNNNLAYTYYKGLRVICQEERTEYEWKEMELGDVGLLASNFIYPDGLIVDGVDYSNKSYNFVLMSYALDQNNFVRQLLINEFDLPSNYTEQDIIDYVLALPLSDRTIAETDSKWNIIIYNTTS